MHTAGHNLTKEECKGWLSIADAQRANWAQDKKVGNRFDTLFRERQGLPPAEPPQVEASPPQVEASPPQVEAPPGQENPDEAHPDDTHQFLDHPDEFLPDEEHPGEPPQDEAPQGDEAGEADLELPPGGEADEFNLVQLSEDVARPWLCIQCGVAMKGYKLVGHFSGPPHLLNKKVIHAWSCSRGYQKSRHDEDESETKLFKQALKKETSAKMNAPKAKPKPQPMPKASPNTPKQKATPSTTQQAGEANWKGKEFGFGKGELEMFSLHPDGHNLVILQGKRANKKITIASVSYHLVTVEGLKLKEDCAGWLSVKDMNKFKATNGAEVGTAFQNAFVALAADEVTESVFAPDPPQPQAHPGQQNTNQAPQNLWPSGALLGTSPRPQPPQHQVQPQPQAQPGKLGLDINPDFAKWKKETHLKKNQNKVWPKFINCFQPDLTGYAQHMGQTHKEPAYTVSKLRDAVRFWSFLAPAQLPPGTTELDMVKFIFESGLVKKMFALKVIHPEHSWTIEMMTNLPHYLEYLEQLAELERDPEAVRAIRLIGSMHIQPRMDACQKFKQVAHHRKEQRDADLFEKMPTPDELLEGVQQAMVDLEAARYALENNLMPETNWSYCSTVQAVAIYFCAGHKGRPGEAQMMTQEQFDKIDKAIGLMRVDLHKTFGSVGELGKFIDENCLRSLEIYARLPGRDPQETTFWIGGKPKFSDCLHKWCQMHDFPKLTPTAMRTWFKDALSLDPDYKMSKAMNKEFDKSDAHDGKTAIKHYCPRKAQTTAAGSKAATLAIFGRLVSYPPPEKLTEAILIERCGELSDWFRNGRRQQKKCGEAVEPPQETPGSLEVQPPQEAPESVEVEAELDPEVANAVEQELFGDQGNTHV